MNVLNRVVAILFALALLTGGLLAFYLTISPPTESAAYVQAWTVYLSEQATLGSRIAVGVVGAIAVLGGALILLLERPRRAKTTVQLKKVNGGEGILSVGAIAQRVQHDTELLGGIRRAKPVVFGRGNKVDIRVDITTDPYVEAAAKTQEACQAIRDNVEGQMGVKVRRVTVRINHEPIRDASPNSQTSGAS